MLIVELKGSASECREFDIVNGRFLVCLGPFHACGRIAAGHFAVVDSQVESRRLRAVVEEGDIVNIFSF
ncbi:hypothetical protein D3C87_2073170 [compost metagenome]